MDQQQRVISFQDLRMGDVERVGGKNASLGEMIGELAGEGIRVPDGFATTAYAFREFLAHNGLAERIGERLRGLDVDDVAALAKAGAEIRGWVVSAPLQPALESAIGEAYRRGGRGGAGRDLGGAIVGHGGRPARRLIRRPTGNISKYQWIG